MTRYERLEAAATTAVVTFGSWLDTGCLQPEPEYDNFLDAMRDLRSLLEEIAEQE